MSSAPSASSAPSPSSNKWALKSALRVLTVILVPCVVMLALNEFTMPLLMMLAPVTPTTPHVAYYPSAHTHEALTDPKLAFFFGGQGIYATSELFKCLTAMESLSKIGGWKGDVYFLISNTYCLPEDVMHKLQNKNVHIVKVDEQNSKSWIPSKQRNEEKMNIKMQILQYIPKDSPIEVVMWYDCDVLFVVPGCVATMIRNKPKITPQNPLFITLGSGIGVHVGSFSASPQHSGPALDLWSDNIVQADGTDTWVQDYVVFARLFGLVPNNTWGLMHPIYRDVFPRSFDVPAAQMTQCVVHLTNGRCTHLAPGKIHKFVKSLHLDTYKDSSWCPSLLRRKMKSYGYTWPFCWQPPSFLWADERMALPLKALPPIIPSSNSSRRLRNYRESGNPNPYPYQPYHP